MLVIEGHLAPLDEYVGILLVLSSHGDWEVLPDAKNPTHQADVIWGTDATIPVYHLTERLTKADKPCIVIINVGVVIV
mgnify:CR=1 FL=1